MPQFKPGKMVNLSRLVHRVVANNSGPMTGPGTNTYLIGNSELAIIDPGPDDQEHIDAILAAARSLQGVIRWILCTHSHHDHSTGASRLKEHTGAEIYGQPAPDQQLARDESFSPDQVWAHHSRLQHDEFTILAIHTPGHASNHLCFLLEEEQMIFTGDHIMGGSTVVIPHPDGNMAHYLTSLEKIKTYNAHCLAPGHGDLIHNPNPVIEGTIQHRLMREQKTLNALGLIGPCDLNTLVSSVYDEVPSTLHPVAKQSLRAHLEKLQEENRVLQKKGIWQISNDG